LLPPALDAAPNMSSVVIVAGAVAAGSARSGRVARTALPAPSTRTKPARRRRSHRRGTLADHEGGGTPTAPGYCPAQRSLVPSRLLVFCGASAASSASTASCRQGSPREREAATARAPDGLVVKPVKRRAGGGKCYLVAGCEYWRANPAIPLPVGYPDRGRRCAAVVGLPLDTGEGEVDWVLVALQNAAASSAGPGT